LRLTSIEHAIAFIDANVENNNSCRGRRFVSLP